MRVSGLGLGVWIHGFGVEGLWFCLRLLSLKLGVESFETRDFGLRRCSVCVSEVSRVCSILQGLVFHRLLAY